MPQSTTPDEIQHSPIAYGLATMFVLGLLLAAWLMRSHEATLDDAVAASRAAAKAQSAIVARLLDSIDETNRVILEWNASASTDPQLEAGTDALLQTYRRSAPHYVQLLLLDARGTVLHSSGGDSPPELRDRPYFRAHLARDARPTFVDEPRQSRTQRGQWQLAISRASRSAGGELERVVVAVVDARVFERGLQSLGDRPGSIAVVHRAGAIVAHSRDSLAPGRQTEVEASSGPLGGPDLAGLGWIEPVGTEPLAVVVETERAAVLATWRQHALIGLFFFITGGGFIFFLFFRQARQAKSLTEAEQRYRALTEQSLIGIFLLRDQQLLYANPRLSEILGAGPEHLGSRDDLLGFVGPSERQRFAECLGRWQDDKAAAGSARFPAMAMDGSSLDLEMQGRQVILDGKPAALVVVSDATEQAHARRELQAMAYHDPLTGLPNRALLFDRLTQTLARTQRAGSRFALMLIDLDGFKDVNDTLGHEAGDGVLRAVADRLLASLRESDTVARMGGDEFIVILSTTPGVADAESVARKLLAELARPIPLRLSDDPQAEPALALVSGSIGLALYPDHGESTDALIAAADGAMYRAKNAGKNRHAMAAMPVERTAARRGPFIAWSPEFVIGIDTIDNDHNDLFTLVNDLAAAIRDGEPPAIRDALVDALRQRTIEHFRDEEAAMQANGYDGVDGHVRQHRELLRKLGSLEHLLSEHGPSMALKTLRDWLLLHINTADRQYAGYLRARQNLASD